MAVNVTEELIILKILEDVSKSDDQRSEEKRLHRITNAYRTEICRIYRSSGMCRYGDKCRFAHTNEQLRSRQLPHNYKTKLCRNFEQFGCCFYGAKCLYIHRSQLLSNHFVHTQHFTSPRISNSLPVPAPFSFWDD